LDSSVLVRAICREVETFTTALDPIPRAIMVLHYYVGMDLRQVARTIGMPEARTSALHTEAVLALAALLERIAR
jgi:DNA-directed RNA polymerase specialized sigma24 family protein